MKDFSINTVQLNDYVIYKEYNYKSGLPVLNIGSTCEFVQVLLNVTAEKVENICKRLNYMCRYNMLNLRYSYSILEDCDDSFEDK